MESMKKIILKSIKLQNWSSISCLAHFSDARTKIMGANGVGKSSIINAWRWLLTSRVDAVHPANYELFDKRVPLTPDTPTAIVEAVIEINGCEYTLTRKAKASFVKGVKAASDKYTTLIDNIEYTATQFNEWLEVNIAPTAMLPFCIDGIFFATLCEEDKKKGRKVLEGVVGEITQADFNGDYSLIQPLLDKLPIEKVVEKVKADKAVIKERIEKLPIELETKESILAEWSNIGDIDAEIESVQNRISELDAQINGAVDESVVAERKRIFAEINSKELSLAVCKNARDTAQYALTSGIKAQISEVLEYNKDLEWRNELLCDEWNRKKRLHSNLLNQLNGLRREREVLIQKRDEIKTRQFTETKCAYCGQELPDDMLKDLRDQFLAQKKKEYDAVVLQGKSVAAQIKECEEQITQLEEALSTPLLLHTPKESAELVKQLADAEAAFVPFEETDEYKRIADEIANLKAILPESSGVDTSDLIREKQEQMQKLNALLGKRGSTEQVEKLENDIAELRKEQRELGIKVAELQGVEDKCKEWIEERANIVSNRINDKLQGCSIQMFSIQKNGEQAPDCVILDKNGVKYGKTNTAETLKVNIALQKLFMAHFGVELPIFVDECSRFSPSNVPNMDGQHILVFATDDKILNIVAE